MEKKGQGNIMREGGGKRRRREEKMRGTGGEKEKGKENERS